MENIIYGIKYKILDLIQSFGCYLEYSYKLHGYKQNRRLWLKRVGSKIWWWATLRKDVLIEKYMGHQGSWGWIGSELEGLGILEAIRYTMLKK